MLWKTLGIYMAVLEKQLEKIEVSKTRLKNQERLLKLKKKQEENKKLYQIGKIAKRASILDIDPDALLGAFLDIQEKLSDDSQVKKWKEKAASLSKNETDKDLDSVVVNFKEEPTKEAKEAIKSIGLRWNKFRQEWYGYAVLDEVKSSLEKFGATVTSV